MFPDKIELPAAADFHVHLRDGAMAAAVVPTIRSGGVSTAYVMPNLVPPLTSVAAVAAYRARLTGMEPSVRYLMTLYLHKDVTPETIREAAATKEACIAGVKSYPAGVTTNSDAGVLSYEPFYPVFEEMQRLGLVLNLHGECPNDAAEGIDVMNAESKFLPTLKDLHLKFPDLKIVLEHCTTADAVEAVKSLGKNVAGTITAHHLFLTHEDWKKDPFSFCKPVAKLESDRKALLNALLTSNGKFFLGSDSAPHPVSAKQGDSPAAGAFTQPYACQLVLQALDDAVERGELDATAVTPQVIGGFLGGYGRRFYGIEDEEGKVGRIRLLRGGETICDEVSGDGGVQVRPFRSGKKVWSVEWL